MNFACALCSKPATQVPPPMWWVAPDRLACSHACAAGLNELRSTAKLPAISWRYVERRGEPRETALSDLAVDLTLAWLRSRRGPGCCPPAQASPDGADEYHFLVGASVVILSRRQDRVRC